MFYKSLVHLVQVINMPIRIVWTRYIHAYSLHLQYLLLISTDIIEFHNIVKLEYVHLRQQLFFVQQYRVINYNEVIRLIITCPAWT